MISTERLRRYPIFDGTPEDILRQVVALSRERAFEAGDRLFEEGSRATHLMLLDSGEVGIAHRLADGKEVIVDSAAPGEMLGWSALMEPFMFTASGIARRRGVMLEINGEGLRRVCEANPGYGYHMMKEVAKTLRRRMQATRAQLAAQPWWGH
ncbi:MAG: cyclic nucleotide-binding domain-containing protein [Chloroflexota bacterium]